MLQCRRIVAPSAAYTCALSADTGRVDVRWGSDGETLTMVWTEREGPPVSEPKRRGFGTVVMEAMAERSADGKVQVDYGPLRLNLALDMPRGKRA